MTALAVDRNTPERPGELFQGPCVASDIIYKGSLVCRDSSGNIAPVTATTGLIGVGRSESHVDNSAGAAGDLNVDYRSGVFRWGNGDTITKTSIGDTAYGFDDQTVKKTSTGLSPVGIIVDVDADGVWVDTNPGNVLASTGLLAANNLSDLGTLATAQSNLGLTDGTLAARFEDVTVDDDCLVSGIVTGLHKTQVVAASLYTVVSADDGDIVVLAGADNDVVQLPACAAANLGLQVTVINTGADGAALVSISPNAADQIFGTIANAAADSVSSAVADKDWQNTKATANNGDYTRLVSDGSTGWYIVGGVGIWASQA